MQNFRPVFMRTALMRSVFLFMAGLAIVSAHPAQAQNADLQTLIQRIERMGEDLRILQKDYYRGQKTGAGRLAAGQPGGKQEAGRLAGAEIRMSNLETDMRHLTGQLEEVRHDMATMLQRLDGLVNDVDFRLTEIERRLAGTRQKAPQNIAGADAKAGAAPTKGNNAEQAAAPAGGTNGILPQGTAIERYNFAYSLIIKVRLEDAETAFQEFLEKHGDDPLAGNAQYWLGETYYARKDLNQAARAFLTGIQRYPNSSKAPDTMLKLGITLGKLGKGEDACAAYLEMGRKFPNLQRQTRKRMVKEMKRGGCN